MEHFPRLHAVLAVEEAVVGREQDQRVVELTGGAQRGDDLGDPFVDGEQRLESPAIPSVIAATRPGPMTGRVRIPRGLSLTSAR